MASQTQTKIGTGRPLWRRFLPLIGLGLLAWVLFNLDHQALWHAVAQADPILLAAGAALFALNVFLKGVRWWRMLATQGIHLGLLEANRAFLVGAFWGLVTPGRLGELFRIEILLRRGISPGVALVASLFDRIIDLGLLLVLGGVLGAWVLGSGQVAIGCLLTLVILLPLALLARPRLEAWARGQASKQRQRGPFKKVWQLVGELLGEAKHLVGRRALAEALGWSALCWAAYFGNIALIATALEIQAPLYLSFAATAFAAVSALLPITYHGLGTREMIFSIALAKASVPSALAVAFALVVLASMFGTTMVMGLWGLWGSGQQDAKNPVAPDRSAELPR